MAAIPISASRKTIACLLLAFSIAGAAGAKETEQGATGAFIKIEPIIVNLLGNSQFLQIVLSVRGGSNSTGDAIKAYMPVVRHELIMLLSGKRGDDILTVDGKTRLMDEIRSAVNRAISPSADAGVREVAIEQFIVQ